jgi:mannose-6-phosphate isomerase-like protein (cupin superfamily)
MRLPIVGAALAWTAVWAGSAPAQNPLAVPTVERTILAATKLPDLAAAPVSFCALSVTIPANAASHIVAGSNAIFYQLDGSTEITTAGATKTLGPGEALFVAGGHEVFLKALGDDPSRSLHFVLVQGSVFDSPVPTEPATVTELFRTPAPIADLKPGAYEVNLTRVTFPPKMSANPPHHRSGAALYYILSGTGANTVGGNTVEKGPDSVIYEPSSLVHQWGNPGSEPFTFLAFNINPEGEPAVVPEAPAKP